MILSVGRHFSYTCDYLSHVQCKKSLSPSDGGAGRGDGCTYQAEYHASEVFCSYFAIRARKSSGRPAIGNRKPAGERRTDRGHHRRGRREGSQAPDSEAEATEPDSLNKKKKQTKITNLYWISREMRIKIQQ